MLAVVLSRGGICKESAYHLQDVPKPDRGAFSFGSEHGKMWALGVDFESRTLRKLTLRKVPKISFHASRLTAD